MKAGKLMLFFAFGVLMLALAACSPATDTLPGTGGTPGDLDDVANQAVMDARDWLARETGVDVASIQVVDVSRQEFSDSCLGLGGPAESCLQVITPGYQAIFEVNGMEYEVRMDEAATTFRSPQFSQ
jgi:hypothetical protein